MTRVIYHDIHAQYMYHVVYSDGDACDYWRHELEMIKCTCVPVPVWSREPDYEYEAQITRSINSLHVAGWKGELALRGSAS